MSEPIPGVEVVIGGQTFTAAPLNFKALRQYGQMIDEFGAGRKTKMSDLPLLLGVIAASLRRNHPDMTDEFLDENVDTVNVRPLLEKVMQASGVGGAPAGEQKPVAEPGQTATGTSASST